jgi:radical SAM protein (TIGR01212 family)
MDNMDDLHDTDGGINPERPNPADRPNPALFAGGRRYRALAPELRALFGGPVWRVPLDAGFSCPTRDGAVGRGGCRYCDAGGARSAAVEPALPVAEQLARGIARLQGGRPGGERGIARLRAKRMEGARFIAYLQAFTNTYASPERLERVYAEALGDPRVVALAVATRPDCLSEPVLDVLERVARRTFLWVEVGLQSTSDVALAEARRGHDVTAFADAARRLRARGIRFVTHLIFGLPGDTPAGMLAAGPLLGHLGTWGVKVHQLYVDRDARWAEEWREGRLPTLSREDYVKLVAGFLERLPGDVVIHRLMGEAPRERLLAPDWCADKSAFLRALDEAMAKRETWQGRLWRGEAEEERDE